MSHHLVDEFSIRVICPYCSENLRDNRWESRLVERLHYRTTTCGKCSREIRVNDHLEGIGFDKWEGKSNFPHEHWREPEKPVPNWDKKQSWVFNTEGSIDESKDGKLKTIENRLEVTPIQKPVAKKLGEG